MVRTFARLSLPILLLCSGAMLTERAEAAVTRTAQASLEVSAYVESRCEIATGAARGATALDALRAVSMHCTAGVPATIGAARATDLPYPATLQQDAGANGSQVVVVTY